LKKIKKLILKIQKVILMYEKMNIRTNQIRNNSKGFSLKSDHRLIYDSSMNNDQPITRRKTKEIKTALKIIQDRAEPSNSEIFSQPNLIKLRLGQKLKLRSNYLNERLKVIKHYILGGEVVLAVHLTTETGNFLSVNLLKFIQATKLPKQPQV
jgi:hypothetical protein